MLFLLFSVGPGRYALPVDRVVEVVPLVETRPIPQAPPAVVGLMNYRGRPVPVIDLRRQFLDEASEKNLSTRIIVVFPQGKDGEMVGLVGERATETERYDEKEFMEQNIQLPSALQLGPVRMSEKESIQLVRVDRLLTPAMKQLFEGLV